MWVVVWDSIAGVGQDHTSILYYTTNNACTIHQNVQYYWSTGKPKKSATPRAQFDYVMGVDAHVPPPVCV